MKFCKNCGKLIESNLNFCKNCGQRIEHSIETIATQTIEETPKQNKSKKPIIICIIVSLFALGIFLGKDTIMYNYYIIKGNKESLESKSVSYYRDALNIKYNDDLIDKIIYKIKDDEDFEQTLESLCTILELDDLNRVYSSVYSHKAKENFEKHNYKTCINYLNLASIYGYDTNKFEYYSDLIEIEDYYSYGSDYETIYNNQDDYIIADSNTRYLTKSELLQYSKTQLAYIRNEIFARHGYIFTTEEYHDYFLSKSWYTPNPYFSGSHDELNDFEIKNINLIKEIEKN